MPDAPAGDAIPTTNAGPISSTLVVGTVTATHSAIGDAADLFAQTGDRAAFDVAVRTALNGLVAAARAEGAAEVATVKKMLEGLLAQVNEELAAAASDRMRSYHSGAQVALLAALNFEPLRQVRSPSSGTEAQP